MQIGKEGSQGIPMRALNLSDINLQAICEYLCFYVTLRPKHFVKSRTKPLIQYERGLTPTPPIPRIKWMRETLVEAIRTILQTHPHEVAVLASGGIDSSTVASMAASIVKPETLHVYHGTYDREEASYAEALAQHVENIKLHTVRLTGEGYPESTQLVYQNFAPQFHPQGGPSMHSQLQVAKRIQEDGFKTVLCGEGGDEVFLGYPMFHLIPFKFSLATLYVLWHARFWVGFLPWDFLNDLRRKSVQPSKPFREQFYLSRLMYPPEFIVSLFKDEIRKEINAKEIKKSFIQSLPVVDHPLDAMQGWCLTQYLPSEIDIDETVAKTHGLTAYAPLLNSRVIEHVLSLPPNIRASSPNLKTLLRRIAEPYLPPKILKRKDKRGFPTPFFYWMRGSKLEQIHQLLLSDGSKTPALFDADAVRNILMKYEEGNNLVAFLIFQLTQIEYWLRAILQDETMRPRRVK